MTLLDATEISKRFSGIMALDAVSLTVEPGESVGLIGPNGAGKTTFFNCLLGMLRPDGGRVVLDGTDITRAPVHKRARLGIGRTFQRIELFGGMTVRDHLLVAERSRLGTGRLWKDCLNLSQPSTEERERCDHMLGLLGLDDVADGPIEALSLGRGRLVELGRALMTDPRLLLLDEPSSGLDQHETRDLVRTIQDVQREHGTAILLVEHDVEMVQSFASRLYVLDFGTVIAEGPTSEVMADEAVRKAYLGELVTVHEDETETVPPPPAAPATTTASSPAELAPLLELRDVDAGYGPFRALFGVSFSVHPGHAVALLGSNGAGKTTVARVISGLVPVTDGTVRFDGVDITGMKPWRIAPLGIVHAPEGRSVFGTLTVEENLTLEFRRSLGRKGVSAGLERAFELFPRLGERRKQVAGTLSGGEQRMLALARVLVQPPRLLIVDELSLGLAPIIIDEVYATLERVRQEGTTLLLIEQYVGHALRVADAVVLLQHGEVVYDGSVDGLGDISQRLLREELELVGSVRVPSAEELFGPSGTPRVVVVGAGFGGIAMGVKLHDAGIDSFTIYESSLGIGGTWWDNTYPGAEVDVGSNLYCFSFKPHDWTRTHAKQPELQKYLEETVDEHGLRHHLRLGVAVQSAEWDDERHVWAVRLDDGTVDECHVLVSAVGFLNVPRYPDWPGLDEFEGPVFHTARWEHQHDLTGKVVAVVGTGSSATQVVPAIQPIVRHLYVFQREPGWVLPKGERDLSDEERATFSRPLRRQRDRWRQKYQLERSLWGGRLYRPETKVNQEREAMRRRYIARQFADRPDLRDAVTPTYPYPGKRPVIASSFYPALKQGNVELVPRAVASVTPTGIVDADGVERAVDVVVLATGFQPANYLARLPIVGREGRSLQEQWAGEPRAYLGITVPGFPNFFMLYGPGTNGGEIVTMLESQAEFAARAVKRMRRERVTAIEVKPRYEARWNRWLQSKMQGTSWTMSNNYFKSPTGTIVTQWPSGNLHYRALTKLFGRVSETTRRRRP